MTLHWFILWSVILFCWNYKNNYCKIFAKPALRQRPALEKYKVSFVLLHFVKFAVTVKRYPGIHKAHIWTFVLVNAAIFLSFFYCCSILHLTRNFHSQYTYQEVARTYQKNQTQKKNVHIIFFVVADRLLFLYCMRCHMAIFCETTTLLLMLQRLLKIHRFW